MALDAAQTRSPARIDMPVPIVIAVMIVPDADPEVQKYVKLGR